MQLKLMVPVKLSELRDKAQVEKFLSGNFVIKSCFLDVLK